MNRPLRAILAPMLWLLSACAPHGAAEAQTAPALSPSDAAMQSALLAAEQGRLSPDQARALANHPLHAWLDVARIRQSLSTASASDVAAALQRDDGQPAGIALADMWRAELARRQDWNTLSALDADGSDSQANRCLDLLADAKLGRFDDEWTQDARKVWRSGRPWASACREPMALLEQRGGVDDALRWNRFDAALEQRLPAVMRDAGRSLSPDQAKLAGEYADFLGAPRDSAMAWPKTTRSRAVIAAGLEQEAKNNASAVEVALPKWSSAFALDDAQRGRVLAAIARASAIDRDPRTPQRFAAVPASAFDDALHEMRARDALSRGDWPTTLAAIRAMPDALRNTSRWTYFLGRALEQGGQREQARAAYAAAARSSEFHGFLAADRLHQPYRLCPLPTPQTPLQSPGFQRALALHRIGRNDWAVREWSAAAQSAAPAQRLAAVRDALAQQWFDRAAFGLDRTQPQEMRLLDMRFPLHYDADIERAASTNRLDPAWVAAEVRAESLFDPRARSNADARGLMQLIPETGQRIARRNGIGYVDGNSLYDPGSNIAIGSAYLRDLLDRAGGALPVVIAGYNAGPNAAARWKSERPTLEADAWIEAIPYKETREYVPRVLGFSVMYDWRMHGKMLRLGDRIGGRLDGERIAPSCDAVN
ncbi:lytic transglycosylase domain-containing protein [Solilutibacter silvestris]|uniref:Transglycosylase SLT domain n=1 Tax=Solilutibacter silvestris TaxID=1645665 RepID=A0A2K1Q1M6_9GAMM|nr:lytic transglycosylase domain-containing protein [Lysobacter silvestris]PNS08932.1 Transglycosylase SLT domain [Lysobacter silvestris]